MRSDAKIGISKKFLKLGTIGRAQGLKGSFFVSGRDEPWPDYLQSAYIGPRAETTKEAKIEESKWQNGRVVLKCSLAQDRTQADSLKGQFIWAPAESIKVDDQSEYLLSDLKGRAVLDCNGELLGTVESAYVGVGGVNIVVVNDSNTADVEIPMIRDYIDMNFVRGGTDLKLIVPADIFDDIWNPRRS